MAKLTGPFFSLKASGQLGKTLVAFPWKGINALRTYVVPANPQSDAQTDQRDIFTAAVKEWHDAAYTALDVLAWNRLAGIADKIMSGFNRMVREFVNEGILENVWTSMKAGRASGVGVLFFTAIVAKVSAGVTPKVHWGKSKTHFPNSADMVDNANDSWFYDITDLTANTLYYFYFSLGVSGADFSRTGIYSQRTLPTP